MADSPTPIPAEFDLWASTPGADVLSQVDATGISTTIGIIGVAATLFVAYGSVSKNEPNTATLCATASSGSFLLGFSAYVVCLQMRTFGLAGWLASLSGSSLLVHLPLFIALFTIVFTFKTASRVNHLVLNRPLLGIVAACMAMLGFILCYVMLRLMAVYSAPPILPWIAAGVAVIMLPVSAIIGANLTLIKRLAPCGAVYPIEPGDPKDERARWSLGISIVAFVALEIALKLFAVACINAPGFIAQETIPASESVSRTFVKPNIMLIGKVRLNYDEDQSLIARYEFSFDENGLLIENCGYDSDDTLFIRCSNRYADLKEMAEEIDAAQRKIYVSKLDGGLTVLQLKTPGNKESATCPDAVWVSSEWAMQNGEQIYTRKSYLDKSLSPLLEDQYYYAPDSNLFHEIRRVQAGGVVSGRWVFERDAKGEICVTYWYKGLEGDIGYTEIPDPAGGTLITYADGSTKHT